MDVERNKALSSGSVDKRADGDDDIDNCKIQHHRGTDSPIFSLHPLDILPPEMWSMVFSYLKDNNDLTNVSRASMAWNDILKLEKCRFLFPEVMPVIGYMQLSPFNMRPTQSTSDIRNLRLVCHTWKSSIDKYIQHHPCHFQLNEPSPTNTLKDYDRLKVNSRVAFSNPQHLHNFQTGLANYTGENPFLSRHLFVTDINRDARDESDQIWTSLKNILLQWGSEIWYFGVAILSEHLFFQVYINIQQCLCLMPNLKVLEFIPMEPMCRRLEEIEYLGNTIRMSPFPRLDKLEVFSGNVLPTPLLNEALSKFSNIHTLVIDKYRDLSEEFYDYDARNIQLPNLKEVTIPLATPRDLISLGNVNWPLVETLTLVIYCKEAENEGDNNRWLDITDVFTVLNRQNHFGKRLKNLTIKLDGFHPLNIPTIRCNFLVLEWVDMPCLEKFHLDMKSVCMNEIDFVKKFRNLKELRVSMDNYLVLSVPRETFFHIRREEEKSAEIKFFSFMNGMNYYESNVWEVLANLESLVMIHRPNVPVALQFQTFRFSRKQYEAKQLKGTKE